MYCSDSLFLGAVYNLSYLLTYLLITVAVTCGLNVQTRGLLSVVKFFLNFGIVLHDGAGAKYINITSVNRLHTQRHSLPGLTHRYQLVKSHATPVHDVIQPLSIESSSHRFTISPPKHYNLDQTIIFRPADMPKQVR